MKDFDLIENYITTMAEGNELDTPKGIIQVYVYSQKTLRVLEQLKEKVSRLEDKLEMQWKK